MKQKKQTFEYESSKTSAINQLLGSLSNLKTQILTENNSEIDKARIQVNIAFIDYELLQTNIKNNTMSIVFNLFVLLFIILLIFVISTAIFAIRLKKSQKSEQSTSDFNQKILEAQETERKRLSMELHDTIAQNLRAVQLLTEQAFSASGKEGNDIQKQVLELESKAIIDIRTLCYNLTPPDLDRKDLRAAITHYCSTFKRDTGINCSLVITENCDFSKLTAENQLDIFRLIQESLTNVAKHSQAEEVTVIFRTQDSPHHSLMIFITDDGVGFDLSSAQFLDSHFGLKGMRERCKFLGGILKINTELNEGTEIQIEIPLSGETK